MSENEHIAYKKTKDNTKCLRSIGDSQCNEKKKYREKTTERRKKLLFGRILGGFFFLFSKLLKDLPDAERKLGLLVLVIVGDDHVFDLVAPEETVLLGVLGSLPEVEELDNAVGADMVGVLLCLIPVHWCSERQETHGAFFE